MKTNIFNIQKIKKRIIWTSEEDNLLIKLSLNRNRKSWVYISSILKNKSPYQCFLRFRSINPNIKIGCWSQKEDKKLLSCVDKYGHIWYKIAHMFVNRSAQQIRERYINYLDPNINRSKFSVEEDLLLLELHKKYGNRWSLIRRHMPHRSADMIKNRYNSSVKRNKTLVNNMKNKVIIYNTNESISKNDFSFTETSFTLGILENDFNIDELFKY